MEEVIEVEAALYTPQGKERVTVEVNWVTGCVTTWSSYHWNHHKETINSRLNFEFFLLKRGWIYTDFRLVHREKPLVYKLTFVKSGGDIVQKLLDVTKELDASA
jgi:hypothetical protein